MNRMMAALLASFVLVLSACGTDSGDETATDDASSPASQDAPSESATPSETPTDDAETTETSEPSTPDGPACDDVWTDGGRIPGRYQGCLDGELW